MRVCVPAPLRCARERRSWTDSQGRTRARSRDTAARAARACTAHACKGAALETSAAALGVGARQSRSCDCQSLLAEFRCYGADLRVHAGGQASQRAFSCARAPSRTAMAMLPGGHTTMMRRCGPGAARQCLSLWMSHLDEAQLQYERERRKLRRHARRRPPHASARRASGRHWSRKHLSLRKGGSRLLRVASFFGPQSENSRNARRHINEEGGIRKFVHNDRDRERVGSRSSSGPRRSTSLEVIRREGPRRSVERAPAGSVGGACGRRRLTRCWGARPGLNASGHPAGSRGRGARRRPPAFSLPKIRGAHFARAAPARTSGGVPRGPAGREFLPSVLHQ